MTAILIAIFGALVTVIQLLGLNILNDIRDRVTRLESIAMGKK